MSLMNSNKTMNTMKISIKLITKFIFVAFAIALATTGCIKDDFAKPEKVEIPVGEILTLADLRNIHDGTPVKFEGDTSIFAVVTMDDKAGNIYRNAFIQDNTGAINLRLMSPGGLYEGDSIRINIKNTVLSSYQGMLQLDSVHVDNNIHKLKTRVSVEPQTLTIPQINTQHQAKLVKLEGVQFLAGELGNTFADSENLEAENRILEDEAGNTIIVRTSGYAAFADDTIPGGSGSVIGVVSQHRDDLQLFIRRLDEVKLDGERFHGGDDPVISIDEDFQSYANHAVINNHGWIAIAEEGGRNWICRTFDDNHYAQATAFNSPDPKNIMWMITPPVDLDRITNPVLEFQSAKAFYTHDGFDVYIATDFDGTDVEEANWETLPATLAGEDDSDNVWIDSGIIDLSQYSGVIHIAWRYEASAPNNKTGTFRVDNVKLYDDNAK